MFDKLKNALKDFFVESHPLGESDTELELSKNEQEKREFQDNYEKVRKTKDFVSFRKQAQDLVLQKMRNTNYGKYRGFMHEIQYLMHYLFLVLHDDNFYGDKIFLNKLMEIDNYIFSAYRRKPNLAKNIKKLAMLAYSNRFSKKPKENILSYLVFLEENDIEIMEILYDYYTLMEQKGKAYSLLFSEDGEKKQVLRKKYDRSRSNTRTITGTTKTLSSVTPTLKENSRNAKLKIYEDDLDKE